MQTQTQMQTNKWNPSKWITPMQSYRLFATKIEYKTQAATKSDSTNNQQQQQLHLQQQHLLHFFERRHCLLTWLANFICFFSSYFSFSFFFFLCKFQMQHSTKKEVFLKKHKLALERRRKFDEVVALIRRKLCFCLVNWTDDIGAQSKDCDGLRLKWLIWLFCL